MLPLDDSKAGNLEDAKQAAKNRAKIPIQMLLKNLKQILTKS